MVTDFVFDRSTSINSWRITILWPDIVLPDVIPDIEPGAVDAPSSAFSGYANAVCAINKIHIKIPRFSLSRMKDHLYF